MMRILRLAAGLLGAGLLLSACSSGHTSTGDASLELGVDLAQGTSISDYDTHGGFHGDGVSCQVLQFPDDSLTDQITQNVNWSCFPLDRTAEALAYGITWRKGDMVYSIGPYLTDNSGEALIPPIQNGYYRLIDRQSGESAEGPLLDRASFNVTFAVYDADQRLLYYCRFDT